MIQALGELHDRQRELARDLGNHAAHCDGHLQLVVAQQGKLIGALLDGAARNRFLGDEDVIEGSMELVHEVLGDLLSLEADLAHRLEEHVLVSVVARAIGHLEQRIVGIVQEFLQQIVEPAFCRASNVLQNRRNGQFPFRRVK